MFFATAGLFGLTMAATAGYAASDDITEFLNNQKVGAVSTVSDTADDKTLDRMAWDTYQKMPEAMKKEFIDYACNDLGMVCYDAVQKK